MAEEFDIVERFRGSIAAFGLEGKTLRVAVSGGADSVALLELCSAAEGDFVLRALHVIHGIRPECEAEAEFVRSLCDEIAVPLDVVSVDVPSHAEIVGIGLEEAGRKLRYRIFADFVERGEAVATAHTADDVVETLLFNLTRGTGPRGLAGIPKERDGIIRPLLDFHRREIERWLRSIGREWREDESNIDLRFSRNRVRWMLLPELRRVFGDSVIDRLRREAEVFSMCSKFLETSAEKLWDTAILAKLDSATIFESSAVLETAWGFGEILRKCAIEFEKPLKDFDFETVNRLHQSCRTARRGRRFPVSGGLHIEADGELVIIFTEIDIPREIPVKLPFVCELPKGMGRIGIAETGDGIAIPFDGAPLSLRPACAGDRIDTERKLRRFLARKQVPRILRDAVPVLFSGDRPIYSPLIGAICPEPAIFELRVRYDGPLENILNRKGTPCANTKSKS